MFHLLGITGAIGAFFGSSLATMLPAKVLKIAFGVAILAGAVRMLTAKKAEIGGKPNLSTASLVFWGILLGIATGIIGIGGGVLMVPVMAVILRFGMRRAVGTSTAVMIFTSAGGLGSSLTDFTKKWKIEIRKSDAGYFIIAEAQNWIHSSSLLFF